MRFVYLAVFCIALTVVTYSASIFFKELTLSLRATANERKDTQNIRNIETRLADLRTELESIGRKLDSTQTTIEKFGEILPELHGMLCGLHERMEQLQQGEQREQREEDMPFHMHFMRKILEISGITFIQFKKRADKLKRKTKEYWEDGEVDFGGALTFPQEELQYDFRYFASPNRDKYTLVLIPSHPEFEENPEMEGHRFAIALTQSGKIYICHPLPKENPEELFVPAWKKENNLPAIGDWVSVDEAFNNPER